jgi:methionyl-tRNA formyltransferase
VNVVVCSTQLWGARAFEMARQGDPDWVLVTKPGELLKACKDAEPEWVFFLHWSTKVGKDVHERYRCVNFHCTPLPYGRGGSPVENMILRGHPTTTLTAHKMTDELDAGDVYGSLSGVSLAGTRDQILDRLIEPAVSLMGWIIRARPRPFPQVGAAVRFERLTDEQRAAFWKDPAAAAAAYGAQAQAAVDADRGRRSAIGAAFAMAPAEPAKGKAK